MHGHDRHNTTILSILHNMSTEYFGQYYFWPSSGWIQWSEKTTQYTGLFISPSGISELDCATTKTDTAERSILTERENSKFLSYLTGARYVHPWWRSRCHNWLSFGKFQDTERFLIHYERHFSSRLPPSGGTCKYAKAPIYIYIYKTRKDSLTIDMLLSAVSALVVAQTSSEIPEGLMNNPV